MATTESENFEEYQEYQDYEEYEEVSEENMDIDSPSENSTSATMKETSGIVLIESFQLKDVESLRFLLQLEEKTIIPAFRARNTFTPSERSALCQCIIKNILKEDVSKTLEYTAK